jgi:transcriptional regulator with XRE-family HTH domain
MPALGRAIADRRRALGITQEGMAHSCDMSLRHLQKIEGGQTNPRLGTLFEIARILKTTAHALLELADPERSEAH